MPVFLLTAWTYLKKYWFIVAAIVGFFVFEIWSSNKNTTDLAKTITDLNKKHQDELDAIQKAHDQEDAQHQADEAKMQAQLASIQAQYDAAQKQLDETKKAELSQIIKDTQGDPAALAQKLSEATGFQVVLPPEGT